MDHVYLSKKEINTALKNHSITKKEAEYLKKKIDCQKKIHQYRAR